MDLDKLIELDETRNGHIQTLGEMLIEIAERSDPEDENSFLNGIKKYRSLLNNQDVAFMPFYSNSMNMFAFYGTLDDMFGFINPALNRTWPINSSLRIKCEDWSGNKITIQFPGVYNRFGLASDKIIMPTIIHKEYTFNANNNNKNTSKLLDDNTAFRNGLNVQFNVSKGILEKISEDDKDDSQYNYEIEYQYDVEQEKEEDYKEFIERIKYTDFYKKYELLING